MMRTKPELFDEPELFDTQELFAVPELFTPELFDPGAADPETMEKILREVHRLQGLLRFRPEADGPGERYTARCAPDYFVLPLLADHFAARFGETPWTIIDEKRRLALVRDRERTPELRPWRKTPVPAGGPADAAADSPAISGGEKNSRPWEELWKHYHRAAANEARTNPGLQRQFMPKRYWKYLPEME